VLNFSSEDESSMVLRNVENLSHNKSLKPGLLENKVLSFCFWFISAAMLAARKKAHEILVHPVNIGCIADDSETVRLCNIHLQYEISSINI
jgi:hypothetical protein